LGMCGPKPCSPACGCGQMCADGTCVALRCDVDQIACGCGCCSAGMHCQAGMCVTTPTVP
jgi:hypothetical protein